MICQYLPYPVQRELFGDRRRYGTTPPSSDADWKRWLKLMPEIYKNLYCTGSFALTINNSGYEVLSRVNLQGLNVTEIGPGGGYHMGRFQGKPNRYTVVDVQPEFFPGLREKAAAGGFPIDCLRVEHGRSTIEVATGSQDIVLSFYSLEHLNPLGPWLDEIFRVLRPGGKLIGAIPTEGGLAWGLGRWMTTRRSIKKQYNLEMRKIICWEHVNFADDIVNGIRKHAELQQWTWPVPLLPYDLSLIVKFVAVKKS